MVKFQRVSDTYPNKDGSPSTYHSLSQNINYDGVPHYIGKFIVTKMRFSLQL